MRKFFACAGLLLSFSVSAADFHPVLYMDTIAQVKSAESYGDELYFVVTEFNSDNKNKQYTIPNYPIHWPSDALPQIKNLKMWDGVITDGETIELVVELVEHDAPPFDVDDSIGALKVKLVNKNGALETTWLDAQTASHTQEKDKKVTFEIFDFKGEGGDYRARFYLSQEEPAKTHAEQAVKSTKK